MKQRMSTLAIKRDEKKRKIWSHVRSKWLVETPEETVRQEYLLVLVNEYGFDLPQISEEMDLTGRGSASSRADFVIWRTAQDKADNNAPFIIVECKSDNVTIKPQDYLAAISVDKLKPRYPWGGKAVFVLIVPLFIAEAAMTSMGVSSKESWRQRPSVLDSIVPENLPDDSILFFAQRSGPPFADELDAMWVSLRHGKKTMNGYSGSFPADYAYEFGNDCSQIPKRVLSYLRFSNQSDDVVAYRELMSRIVPVGFHNCDVEWLKNPPGILKPDSSTHLMSNRGQATFDEK